MDLLLRDRVVVVTGGSRGIGRALVQALLSEGALVATCARGRDGLEALASEIGSDARDRLLTMVADVLDADDMVAFARQVAARFKGMDALIVNAGAGTVGSAMETPWQDFADQFAIKVGAVLGIVRPAVPLLRKSASPRVVIVNGVSAHAPEQGLAAVGAARAALANVTVLLARELAVDGICVNRLNLGPIVTDRQRQRYEESGTALDFADWVEQEGVRRGIPLGRLGSVDEVVPWALMLASPLASYVTGAQIDVSGGSGARA